MAVTNGAETDLDNRLNKARAAYGCAAMNMEMSRTRSRTRQAAWK